MLRHLKALCPKFEGFIASTQKKNTRHERVLKAQAVKSRCVIRVLHI